MDGLRCLCGLILPRARDYLIGIDITMCRETMSPIVTCAVSCYVIVRGAVGMDYV